MAGIPKVGYPIDPFPFRSYVYRPRETFYQRLDRLDFAGRKEALAEARMTGLVPTRQPPFPDIILGLRQLAEQRRAHIADDFAADLKEIAEFRRRFELDETSDERFRLDAAPTEPQFAYAPVAVDWHCCGNGDEDSDESEFCPRRVHRKRLDPPAKPRVKKEERPEEVLPTAILADPAIRNSGIQYFTGTQLDLLV